MRTFVKTGVVLLGLLAGISAASALPGDVVDETDLFGTDAFWSYMIE